MTHIRAILISKNIINALISLLIILPIACNVPKTAEKTVAKQRPNIVFIFTDDHSPNAISAYPGGILDDIAPTPNIDRIADEGLLFENSFCTNSICGPSRASILTSKHSHLNGFIDNETSYFDGLQQTFPKLLQQGGYETAMIGKWHLHSNPIGFDHWEILPGQGSYYNPDFIQMDGSKKRYQGYCTDLITDFAIDWLKEGRDDKKPFVLMFQQKAPHRNWTPPARYYDLYKGVTIPEPETLFDDYADRSAVLKEHAMGIDKHMHWGHDMKIKGENLFPQYFYDGAKNHQYSRMNEAQKAKWDAAYEPENQKLIADIKAGKMTDKDIVKWKYQRYIKDYLTCVRAADDGVGRMLDYLDRSGLAENTIVIYASDQGFYLGEHGWYDKRWMFEESFKMPFVIKWPGVIKKEGRISKALIQNIDYAPTFLDVCGVDIPSDMQGKSIVPILKQSGNKPEGWRDALYYAYYGERTHRVAAHDGVRTENHKLFWIPKTKEWQLFDLEKDPQEMKSVHKDPAYAPILADLQKKYTDLRKEYRVHSALIPAHRKSEKWWKTRHLKFNKKTKNKKHELLFIGDSITQAWENGGKSVWNKYYKKRNALNLGISGDRTEHVIWRLNNGNLHNQQHQAKVAVVMIGTNNTGHQEQAPSETVEGVERILSTLRARCPNTKILLLGIFPRGQNPDDPKRIINVEINKQLAKFDNGQRIHFLDIGEHFIESDGTISKAVMPDYLHLTAKSYQVWAEAMEEKICELGGWEAIN